MNPQAISFLKEKKEEHSKRHNTSYTFSSDYETLFEDFLITDRMGEEYFGTSDDHEQMAISEENSKWIFDNIRDYFNIIKKDGTIVGYSFLMPSTKELMEEFVIRNINEAALFERVKRINSEALRNPEAIYLCSFYVNETERRRGLASIAALETITKIMETSNNFPTLFAWGYSDEGRMLCKKIAKLAGLSLKFRRE